MKSAESSLGVSCSMNLLDVLNHSKKPGSNRCFLPARVVSMGSLPSNLHPTKNLGSTPVF